MRLVGGRWCGLCGFEISLRRRFNDLADTIETWYLCTGCGARRGPALTDDYIFIPMVNGQVESLALDKPKLPAGLYKSFGRTWMQPAVSSNSVAWTTERNALSSARARWRIRTGWWR